VTGCYLTFERRQGEPIAEDEMPLFIREHDWATQKKAWAKESALSRPTVKAQADCENWLAQQFANGAMVGWDKPKVRKAAQDQFGSRLEGRAFDRAWKNVAPLFERNKPGRKSQR
jgi:hypothetical protein